MYLYETCRWDIIPRKLKFESTLTFIKNAVDDIDEASEMPGDYFTLFGELSFEYFFNKSISFKLVGGTDTRIFRYTTEEAQNIIMNPNYGPNFFNSQESYTGLIIGGEFNFIF